MTTAWKSLAALACGIVALAFVARSPSASADGANEKKAPLRHVVFFKFKPDTDADTLRKITDAFAALPTKIDAIQDFEWGTDVGVEGLSKGFTHCFFVTFADAKGRDAYLPHAAHEEFVKLVKPHLEDVCVVDYVVR